MAYTIIIDEDQRKLLTLTLIHAIAGRQPMQVVGNEAESIATLHAMFADLPAAESENPGVVHGFCL